MLDEKVYGGKKISREQLDGGGFVKRMSVSSQDDSYYSDMLDGEDDAEEMEDDMEEMEDS
jgi:hypothetical protein